jgi:hypothetical protein
VLPALFIDTETVVLYGDAAVKDADAVEREREGSGAEELHAGSPFRESPENGNSGKQYKRRELYFYALL